MVEPLLGTVPMGHLMEDVGPLGPTRRSRGCEVDFLEELVEDGVAEWKYRLIAVIRAAPRGLR
jgi:hypothetical protein